MQRTGSLKTSLQTCKQQQQQQLKQITCMLFPNKQQNSQALLQKLLSNLQEYYSQKQHLSYLLHYSFNSHHNGFSRVYKHFLKQKHPDIKQSRISIFYENQYFPDLSLLGEYRNNPQDYVRRKIGEIDQGLFIELDQIFLEYGFIPHLERFLTFYPKYLQKQRLLQKQLFQFSKMDQQTVYFLGLCAAAEMGSTYMINRMTIKYLYKGGKIDWITNNKCPQKIKQLFNINRKLARSVWEINSDDFQELVQQGYWNFTQIALIAQILSYVHSQCIIVLALGLVSQQRNSIIQTQKIEQKLKEYRQIQMQSTKKQKKVPLKNILPNLITLIQQMKNAPSAPQSKPNPKKSFSKQTKQPKQAPIQQQIQAYMKQIGLQLTQQRLVIQILNQLPLIPKYTPIQKRRDNKYNQFTCVDFNFQYKAFPRLQNMNLVAQSTKKMLSLIKYAQEMSFQNFGTEIVNSTKELRKAQRYYGQNLCGFSHPEYDYKNLITKMLTMALKFYIRILILSPLHMKRQIIDQIFHQKGEIQLFDLGHTAVLISISKLKLSINLTTYFFDN